MTNQTNPDRAASAIEWKNRHGRSQWQPVTADGRREWLEETSDMPGFPPYYVPTWKHHEDSAGLEPYLYRSRRRAKRVARHKDRREAAHTWEEA